MTILFHRSSFLIVAMVALFPFSAAGYDAPENPGSKRPPVRAEMSLSEDGDSSWEVQVFVRGALGALWSRGEFGAGFRGESDGSFAETAISTEATFLQIGTRPAGPG